MDEYNIPSYNFLEKKVKQYINNKTWYNNAYHAIYKKYGSDTELFIKLLAVTSPRNTVKTNVIYAKRMYHAIKSGKSVDNLKCGIATKAILRNVKRVIRNDDIRGKKITAFCDALLGNVNSVTVDVWMLKAFNIKRHAPTPLDIKYITHMCNVLSKRLNIPPRSVQACLWCYAKTELNDTKHKDIKDFSYYL